MGTEQVFLIIGPDFHLYRGKYDLRYYYDRSPDRDDNFYSPSQAIAHMRAAHQRTTFLTRYIRELTWAFVTFVSVFPFLSRTYEIKDRVDENRAASYCLDQPSVVSHSTLQTCINDVIESDNQLNQRE